MNKEQITQLLTHLDAMQDIYDGEDYSNPVVTRFDMAVTAFRRYLVRELKRIEAMQTQAWNGDAK